MLFKKKPEKVYRNNLFRNVYPNKVNLNIRSKNFIKIAAGKPIYQVGDNSEYLYLLIYGQIKLKIYGDAKDSKIRDKFSYDFFGEYEIIKNIPRKSSAVAVQNSLLYKLTSDEFKEIIRNKIILGNLNLTDSSIDSKEVFSSSSIGFDSEINPYEKIVNDLGRTNTIINEFSKDVRDKASMNYKEGKDFSDEDTLDSDQRKEKSNLIKDVVKKGESNNDSIIDQIKKDLTDESDSPPEETVEDNLMLTNENNSDNEKFKDQNKIKPDETYVQTSEEETSEHDLQNSDQLLTIEFQEFTKTIVENICDEIQEPLNIIKRYAQLLIHKSSSSDANKILQKIIDHSNQILYSLSTHTSYLNDKLELKTQILLASNVLDDILHLLAGYTEFRNVRLYRKFEADASIDVDKNLIYQAFLHIIKFLCEDLPDDGNIFVTVNRTTEILSIEFKSNGNKIPEEQLAKLFEPFTLSNTSGLELSRRIVSQHEGKIDLKNSIDAGPQITVSLPIVN